MIGRQNCHCDAFILCGWEPPRSTTSRWFGGRRIDRSHGKRPVAARRFDDASRVAANRSTLLLLSPPLPAIRRCDELLCGAVLLEYWFGREVPRWRATGIESCRSAPQGRGLIHLVNQPMQPGPRTGGLKNVVRVRITRTIRFIGSARNAKLSYPAIPAVRKGTQGCTTSTSSAGSRRTYGCRRMRRTPHPSPQSWSRV